MPIVLAVVVALGVFFALKLGLAYAKTEKTEDREEAKKRLVGAVIGFAIGIVAAALMWWLSQSNLFAGLFTTNN
jgi:H+/Cl- antiporter ClcA